MERAARVVCGGRGASRALVVDRATEIGEVVVRPSLRGQAGDQGLQKEPRLEPLEDLSDAEIGDEEAAVDLELDEPVAGEPPSASRTEPREMPSASASSAWPTRAPGASRPSTIIARISS